MTHQPDPSAVSMLFCRTAWMERYAGLGSGDKMSGGGKYVHEHNFGSEILNFADSRGSVFGYVQPPTQDKAWDRGTINLTYLGAPIGAESVSGVLVVWVATNPVSRGGYVVGWYKNATVFRTRQLAPDSAGRFFNDQPLGYYVTAPSEDATLLPPDARVLQVPRGRGGMGQSNIWYARDQAQHSAFRSEVLRFIESGPVATSSDIGVARQADPLRRRLVEANAIEAATSYFVSLGYDVDSVESDNLGWDLFARREKLELRLEVKGLSGSQRVVELTPNEYQAMQEYRDSYRVCIVSDALAARNLSVFRYSREAECWENDGRERIDIREMTGARLSVR